LGVKIGEVREVRCKKCGKPIKEDTEGDPRYCQGHSIFESGRGDDPENLGD